MGTLKPWPPTGWVLMCSLNVAINGMALAFQQSNRNGHRIIAPGGDTGLFHSKMELLLDVGVGFFISFNSTGTGGDVRAEVLDSFIDRYFPAPALPIMPRPSTTGPRPPSPPSTGIATGPPTRRTGR